MDHPNPIMPALGAFMMSVFQLIDALGITEHPRNVSVNWDGRFMRVDVAKLDADGHLAEMLVGLHADVTQLKTFATPAPLPSVPAGRTN
jgi:hypothetical protein